MKSLRLTEVLLPLLAARGWAPWPIEPGVRVGNAPERGPGTPHSPTGWNDRQICRVPFDDVQ